MNRREFLRVAGAVGGCELVAVCEPDPNAHLKHGYRKGWEIA